jgi:hypothetical protein
MSFILILNSQIVIIIQTGNNTFKYDFIKGNFTIADDSAVMIANVQLPYSFYNITSAYNNNQLKNYIGPLLLLQCTHIQLLFLMDFILQIC